MTKEIKIGDVKIGGTNPIVLIAGPCVIESERLTLMHAVLLKEIAEDAGVGLIFKSSYDKANRSSIDSYRGPGLKKGLKILQKVKDKLNIPILSDIHCRSEIKEAARVLDVIQIPAFLSRQTDLILEAARTKRVINVKKGQFLAPWDMQNIIKKIENTGNKKILITERGVSFGYNNLVSDFRSILIMKKFGYPVIYDASHSVQLPGGLGTKSGGEKAFIPQLALAAAASGINGIFLEVHQNPDKAPCDGPNMLPLKDLKDLLIKIKKVERAVNPALPIKGAGRSRKGWVK
ncbi:MAG: 3-deoxy-8-phosphooctulonate synthase [Candidatus Omnitrophica bacterium]|nr:3-deoxy-8-phosphooctulonate synthase [Candidatus Omnitrophota bacterium]